MNWRLLTAATILLAALCLAIPQPFPPAVVPVRTQVYVAATAWSGLESAYSKELPAVATNNQIAIGWNGVGAGVLNYRVYWGTNSGSYPWFQDAGTNLSLLITQVLPQVAAAVSNYVRFYPQVSAGFAGPFSDLPGAPYFVRTNTGGPAEWFRLRVMVTNVP